MADKDNINYIERQIVHYRKLFDEAVSRKDDAAKKRAGIELGNYREMLAAELNKSNQSAKAKG